MTARCVYVDRQMQASSVISGATADVVWFGTLAAVIISIRSPTHWRTCNDAQRAISAPRNLNAFLRVCPKSVGSHREIRRFVGRI